MMKLFLSEYNTIQAMTEKEFIDWLKKKFCEITCNEFQEDICGGCIEAFDVMEIIEGG
jgi:hypothetical protein